MIGRAAEAFGVGAALGIVPGPVQFLLLSESARGGARRGFLAQLGANGTFAAMLLALAAGLSATTPGATFLRVVKGLGGAFLVFLGVDGVRTSLRARGAADAPAPRLHPAARGVVAVLLNPGAYVFLATTASALLADATAHGGRADAFLVAGAMLVGVFVVDTAAVLLGAGGRRALGERVMRAIAVALSLLLFAFGVLLLAEVF